ncbi:glycosyltransferase family 2 protein [Candidatus Cetobacterium colombiensis]|uniref:Glycosyltransferase family 2 protein n=1 Tax=Candidatus Cetobacterium colombiensis TaxID=3073100 RepID=A0ABU4W882_9FUSO|nr:glycosyltransferase family 2 protein [Candidatus Cetobacterium colombiensis]MDX8334899.1 glycosyltransferase family 2 protein [Candidatus Cetobacterium colombiensis]
MVKNKILLSVLIPTFNRDKYLEKALTTFFEQITDDIKENIEIIVSDNHSIDNTEEVLKKFDKEAKLDGLKFKFSKNEENIGPDGNFLKLIKKSNGKFCWIFGDDEFLLKNGLLKILEILDENSELGLLHIGNQNLKNKKEVFPKDETQKFIKNVNYMISFITANIFNKECIDWEINYENCKGSNLIQENFYFQSILKSKENIYLNDEIFTTERADNVGSYKLFETFGKNQNQIFDLFIKNGLEKSTVDFINKKMLREFFPMYILNLDKKSKWENENVYEEMKLTFSQYLEFWIFCVPLIKFPKLIKKPYFLAIRILNKLIKIIGR